MHQPKLSLAARLLGHRVTITDTQGENHNGKIYSVDSASVTLRELVNDERYELTLKEDEIADIDAE